MIRSKVLYKKPNQTEPSGSSNYATRVKGDKESNPKENAVKISYVNRQHTNPLTPKQNETPNPTQPTHYNSNFPKG